MPTLTSRPPACPPALHSCPTQCLVLAKSASIPGFDDTESDGVDEEPEAKETVVADWALSAGEGPQEALANFVPWKRQACIVHLIYGVEHVPQL